MQYLAVPTWCVGSQCAQSPICWVTAITWRCRVPGWDGENTAHRGTEGFTGRYWCSDSVFFSVSPSFHQHGRKRGCCKPCIDSGHSNCCWESVTGCSCSVQAVADGAVAVLFVQLVSRLRAAHPAARRRLRWSHLRSLKFGCLSALAPPALLLKAHRDSGWECCAVLPSPPGRCQKQHGRSERGRVGVCAVRGSPCCAAAFSQRAGGSPGCCVR